MKIVGNIMLMLTSYGNLTWGAADLFWEKYDITHSFFQCFVDFQKWSIDQ